MKKNAIKAAGFFAACSLMALVSGKAQSAEGGAPPDLPTAISSFGAAACDGAYYVLGGHTGKTHAHSTANVSTAFRRWDSKTGGDWEELPGGEGLQGIPLVEANGGIYRIGGLKPLNGPNEPDNLQSVDTVASFDPATRQWQELPALPVRLSSHDATSREGKIYVMGGWTLSGGSETGVWNDKAWVMDTAESNPEWKELPTPPFKRRALALAPSARGIHAIGGMDDEENITKAHDIFDAATQKWSTGPEFPEPGFGISACESKGTLFASGMEGKLRRLNEKGDAWETVGALSDGRFFHRLLPAADGAVVALAGATKKQHLASSEVVKQGAAEATTAAAKAGPKTMSREITFAGTSKNRQGLFLQEGSVFLFGGNNSLEQHDFAPHNFLSEGFKIGVAQDAVGAAAAFPDTRQSMVTMIPSFTPGKGYAFGGFGPVDKAGEARSHSEIFSYDFKADKWEKLAVMLPKPITQFGVAEHDGNIWIFGGMDFDPARGTRNQFQIQSDVYRWSLKEKPDAGFQTTEFKLPRPRRAFGYETMGDKMYLVCGMKENFEPVSECDVFNFKTQSWETIPSPKEPFISPEVCSVGGKLYLAGGSVFTEKDGFQPNPKLLVYDPKSQEWSVLMENIEPMTRHTRMFADESGLVLFTTNLEKASTARISRIEIGHE